MKLFLAGWGNIFWFRVFVDCSMFWWMCGVLAILLAFMCVITLVFGNALVLPFGRPRCVTTGGFVLAQLASSSAEGNFCDACGFILCFEWFFSGPPGVFGCCCHLLRHLMRLH